MPAAPVTPGGTGMPGQSTAATVAGSIPCWIAKAYKDSSPGSSLPADMTRRVSFPSNWVCKSETGKDLPSALASALTSGVLIALARKALKAPVPEVSAPPDPGLVAASFRGESTATAANSDGLVSDVPGAEIDRLSMVAWPHSSGNEQPESKIRDSANLPCREISGTPVA
jgi:hypothetical protein